MQGYGDLAARFVDPFSNLRVVVNGQASGYEDGDGKDKTCRACKSDKDYINSEYSSHEDLDCSYRVHKTRWQSMVGQVKKGRECGLPFAIGAGISTPD